MCLGIIAKPILVKWKNEINDLDDSKQLLNMFIGCFNPIALRTAKTLWSFDCSECNWVKIGLHGNTYCKTHFMHNVSPGKHTKTCCMTPA